MPPDKIPANAVHAYGRRGPGPRWRAAILLGALALLAAPAEAGCRWITDCARGSCREIQECDSVLDPPAPRPPGVLPPDPAEVPGSRPEGSLGAPGLRPPTPSVPVLTCRQAYVCLNQRCGWERTCR